MSQRCWELRFMCLFVQIDPELVKVHGLLEKINRGVW